MGRALSHLSLRATAAVLLVSGITSPGTTQEHVPAANEQGWPHLRGPHYDGIARETGLAESWPETGPPVLWTRELGQGYSGFVVVGGRAFVQFQQLSGQYLICLDAENGREIWRLRYDTPWQRSGAYPGPYASPTWYKGRVYFAAPSGVVGAAEAATGTLIWSRNLLREFRGKGAGFGFACTPLVEDDLVIFPIGGEGASVVALHAHNGATAWQAGDDPASYCPAMPITWRCQRLVVSYLRNALVLHDLKTGRIVGRHLLSADYDEHSAWPLYREPDLLLAAPFRLGAQLLRLEPEADGVKPRLVWATPQLANDVTSSVLDEGHVYGFDLKDLQARPHRSSRGTFRCLDFATGKTHWSTENVGHASLVVADGKLILLNDTGELILARANSEGYAELARHQLLQDGDLSWTQPTLWHGRLFLRNQHRAVCVYLGRPETLTAAQRAQAMTAADLPASRSWDWTWLIGREPEFPNDAPSWQELTAWYAISAGLWLVAALVAVIAYGALWFVGARRAAGYAVVLFWFAAFVLGIVGTPVSGHLRDEFLWTWPMALFVSFELTLQTIVWAEASPARTRARWWSRGAVLGFLAMCWLYYHACQQLGLATAWAFLIGFLPAWPFAVLAARAWMAPAAWRRRVAWLVVAFSVFYWSGGAFIAWKTSIAEVWEYF